MRAFHGVPTGATLELSIEGDPRSGVAAFQVFHEDSEILSGSLSVLAPREISLVHPGAYRVVVQLQRRRKGMLPVRVRVTLSDAHGRRTDAEETLAGEVVATQFIVAVFPAESLRTANGGSRDRGLLPKEGGKRAKPPSRERPAGETSLDDRVVRYANARLIGPDGSKPLDLRTPIEPDAVVELRLDIGALSRESQVENPTPLDLPPVKSFWLDVLVSSTHFTILKSPQDPHGEKTARGRFFISDYESAAVTESGEHYLQFALRAPKTPGLARARATYYYRNTPIQSQLIEAGIGRTFSDLGLKRKGAVRITTDFTTSESFANLDSIPDQRRTSLLVNANGGGLHQVVIRPSGKDGKAAGSGDTLELRESSWAPKLNELRAALRARAPSERQRTKHDLAEDLRQLAVPAHELYTAVAAALGSVLDKPFGAPADNTIQIGRPKTSTFTFPWNLLYEISLDSEAVRDGKLTLCPMVEKWDGKKPLFDGAPRSCPEAANLSHRENVLCPFGFWGYRYSIEQLTSTPEFVRTIAAPSDFRMVTGETRFDIDVKELTAHIERLAVKVRAAFAKGTIERGAGKKEIKTLLGKDVPVVYFYCHGERPRPKDPNTYLGVGKDQSITAGDFIDWVTDWRRYDSKVVWRDVRPLIFVNACHSLDIQPESLVNYLDAFIGAGGAAAVIGTEVKVDQRLAMLFSEEFFDLMMPVPGRAKRSTMDEALREVRLSFLRAGNLFGLVYSANGWADLTVEHA